MTQGAAKEGTALSQSVIAKRGKKFSFSRNIALLLIIAAIASAFTTYVVMTRSENPFGPDPETIITLALVNLALLLALIAVVAHRAYRLWLELRSGSVGSRLQMRIVVMFSLVTMIPTIMVAGFSAFFLNAGIEAWFSERVNTGLEESVVVAEAYLKEHRDIIKADVRSMVSELDREFYEGSNTPNALSKILTAQANLRGLVEAAIVQRGQMLAHTNLTFALSFERLPPQAVDSAEQGNIVVIADDDKIRAVMKLRSMPDAFLVIGRLIDRAVVEHMENAQSAVNEYRAVRAQLSNIQIQFSIMFVLVALLLLLSAIWYGMFFAARLVVPISHLVEAAERVRAGDYATRVDEGPDNDELGTLGRAFNRMTNQLASQRRDLMKANRQLDNRRRFTEAVLSGVSAGVIALDSFGVITLNNRSSQQLLGLPAEEDMTGKAVNEILPEIEPIMREVAARPDRLQQADLTIQRNDKTLTLHARLAAQEFDGELESYILTFDDITPMVTAQRHAAWADVARRVAHEIKNPLTPIQLSAQRLKRKYLKQLDESEHENFAKYTDTIIRHVGDIGRMVEEFVGFARMPAPRFSREDMNDLISRAVFSEETAHPNVTYALELSEKPIFAEIDASQVRQVITNLVKNAAEAIDAHFANDAGDSESSNGHIVVACLQTDDVCLIEVKDNGIGFPGDQIHRLLEPYVTTRAKGTGLGLAIVKKIMEDHNGRVELENRPEGGALVRLVFPVERPKEKIKPAMPIKI
ncbi:MAG: PAS domain-containing sensor histidine kinase [Alphaproteobacteria bacterium]|nr:PAS domain-containing sensor histidine kinase [Alphaproteobacteria bacterium]